MDLFGNETECQIPGLKIIPDYITSLQEEELIESIDNELWLTDLKRRVQHYGYKYDYKARRITDELKLANYLNGLSLM